MSMTPNARNRFIAQYRRRLGRRTKAPFTRIGSSHDRMRQRMPIARYERLARAMFRLFTRTHKAGA